MSIRIRSVYVYLLHCLPLQGGGYRTRVVGPAAAELGLRPPRARAGAKDVARGCIIACTHAIQIPFRRDPLMVRQYKTIFR